MKDNINMALALLLLALWGWQMWRIRRGPVNRERPEVVGFTPPRPLINTEGPPHVPAMVWDAVKSEFDHFDRQLGLIKVQDNLGDQLAKQTMERLFEPPSEPFVPERRYFGPIEGQEMEFCHGIGQLVVHRKTCPRAPHEDRRRYIWAFDAAQLGEWTNAEPGEWRGCRVCRPFAAERSGEAATEEVGDEVRTGAS